VSFYKTTLSLGVAAFMLMAINSEAMTRVQHWVTHFSAHYYSSTTLAEKPNRVPSMNRSPRIVQVTHLGSEIDKGQTNAQKPMVMAKPLTQTGLKKHSDSRHPPAKAQAVLSAMPINELQSLALKANDHSALFEKSGLGNGNENNENTSTTLPEWVLYPNEIVIAFPKEIATTENIKKAVSRVLLSNAPLAEANLLKTQPIDLKQRPYFLHRVLDQHKAPVRYPMQAFKYADYLIEHHVEEHQDEAGKFITLHIPLVEYGISGPAKNYQAWVENYAKEYQIPPSLVYAVMETESAFNPNAVSRSNAIGLMQLKADAAGKDVYQLVDAKPGQPSLSELFDSKSNIRLGTAYLGLLKHDYLAEIKDERIKQMVTISSYNGGLRTVLELFGKTPETATHQLNRMSPKQVYRKLRFEHQSNETRRYLEKVLKAESKYRDLLKAA